MPGRERDANQWTEQHVREILHNPIYVGMGPFPALIDEATWIACQERLFRNEGVQPTLQHIRQVLTATLGTMPSCMAAPDWLECAAAEIARRSAPAYFGDLFACLREELAGMSK
jgi:hypothetical protein